MKSIFLIWSIISLTLGCAVKKESVSGTPPDFNIAPAIKSEYGQITLTSASIFLWPDMPNDAAAEKLYRDVASEAAQSDQLELQREAIQSQINNLGNSGFDYGTCFKNFEAACSANPPAGSPSCDDVQLNSDTVQTWLYTSVDQVPTDDLKKLFVACRNFTSTKVNLKASLDKLTTQDLDLTAKILYGIDPTYQKTGIQTNYKTFANAPGSTINIYDDHHVEIRFDGFADSKNFQSNLDGVSTCNSNPMAESTVYDVAYNHDARSLVFKIPEIINCQATGGVYSFILERTDFAGNPRFSGDLTYSKVNLDRVQCASAKNIKFNDLKAKMTSDESNIQSLQNVSSAAQKLLSDLQGVIDADKAKLADTQTPRDDDGKKTLNDEIAALNDKLAQAQKDDKLATQNLKMAKDVLINEKSQLMNCEHKAFAASTMTPINGSAKFDGAFADSASLK